ncbi:hypothetical protein Tco_1448083 [Tanacetum coccineum]
MEKSRRLSTHKFDTKTERFSKIESPNVDAANSNASANYSASIMVKSDCIQVCVKYDTFTDTDLITCIKLWKLDKDGKMTEVVNYQLRLHDDINSYLVPFHLLKNGNWLLLKSRYRIYEVDLRKKMHIGKEKGKGNIYDDFEYANVRILDKTKIKNIVDVEERYIETFMSPNR